MLKKERPKETGKQEMLNNILQQNHNQPAVMAQHPVQNPTDSKAAIVETSGTICLDRGN